LVSLFASAGATGAADVFQVITRGRIIQPKSRFSLFTSRCFALLGMSASRLSGGAFAGRKTYSLCNQLNLLSF
jgi:hypothetical protein